MSNILTIIFSSLLLSSCFMQSDFQFKEHMSMHGKDFTSELARQYREYADNESRNHDWGDASYFRKKAQRSADRIAVDPEHPEDWDISENMIEELKIARRTLLDVVGGDAIVRFPKVSARAYLLYDCWVEEQEEEWQHDSINSCKSEFFETLDYIMKRYNPEKDQESAQIQNAHKVDVRPVISASLDDDGDQPYQVAQDGVQFGAVVYFASNSVKIDKKSQEIIADIANKVKDFEDYLIILNGHSDVDGNVKQNLKISSLRNISVQKELIKQGVPKDNIEMFGFGESDPIAFNKKDAHKNRRVEIIIQ